MAKTCPGCKDPAAEFGRNKSRPDGLSFYCKKCRAADQRVFVENNPGMIKAMRERNEER